MSTDDTGLKRAACLIASQLPDDPVEAMKVLDYAAGVVRHLQGDKAPVSRRGVSQISLAVVQADGQVAPAYSPGKANPG